MKKEFIEFIKNKSLVIEESIYVVFDEPNCLILYM